MPETSVDIFDPVPDTGTAQDIFTPVRKDPEVPGETLNVLSTGETAFVLGGYVIILPAF